MYVMMFAGFGVILTNTLAGLVLGVGCWLIMFAPVISIVRACRKDKMEKLPLL